MKKIQACRREVACLFVVAAAEASQRPTFVEDDLGSSGKRTLTLI
jgi:hypothetical protein